MKTVYRKMILSEGALLVLALFDRSEYRIGQTRSVDGIAPAPTDVSNHSHWLWAYETAGNAVDCAQDREVLPADRLVIVRCRADVRGKIGKKLFCASIKPVRIIAEMLRPYVCVTVAYRLVRGAAKQYRYTGAKSYRAQVRKDGRVTYSPLAEYGPDRRSNRLAKRDADEYAEKLGLPREDSIRLGTPAERAFLSF